MSPEALAFGTIAELAPQVRNGDVSPVELVNAALDQADRLDERLGVFIRRLDGQARDEARRAEAEVRAGRYRGPLHGMPVTLKDLYDLEGVPTTSGSTILADAVAAADATSVARLRAAGAIVLGKVNLHEFAFGPTGINPHYRTTRNPWDEARVPGGSSGGSGVAVAAGIGVASLGTDTGGSIRIPAALCGVVGLKPTYGRVSRAGVFPLSWACDHVGPLTRSVMDAAYVLGAMAGADKRDPSASSRPVPSYTDRLDGDARGIRAAILQDQVAASHPAVASAFRSAVEQLSALGVELVEVDTSASTYAPGICGALIYSEAAAIHHTWLRTRPRDYGHDVRWRLELGAMLPSVAFVKAQQARAALVERFESVWQSADVVLTPTVPIAAPPIAAQLENRVRSSLTLHTRLSNVLGGPSCSVPCGFTDDGLPVGLLVSGRPFDEERVLRVAHAYEQATDWHRRRPPVG
ncbi:MAG: amidase [Chloroflexi bacterium]|nr:amidase [Chloroflexota bacterium]